MTTASSLPLHACLAAAGWAANAAGKSRRQRARARREQGKTRKSREGKAGARRAQNEAAAALRSEPNRRQTAARLPAAGKPKMAVIGAVMCKLLHQAHGVLKHNQDGIYSESVL